MILAAGRGHRLRPLTNEKPKPLIEVGGKSVLAWLIDALAGAGIDRIVINVSWLSEQIREFVTTCTTNDLEIVLSDEGDRALETGGGIYNALSLLGDEPFIVVNGDIWTDFPYANLSLDSASKAHLVLVTNPAHNPQGDFDLDSNHVTEKLETKYTFSGIGIYSPTLFESCSPGHFSLLPLLKNAMRERAVTGERYDGAWFDIGTSDRVKELDEFLRQEKS